MDLKEQLLLVSAQMFLKYGIKSVSMDDISRQLGISKKTLYEVVENKNDLINAVLDFHLKDSADELNALLKKSEDAIDEIMQVSSHVLFFIANMSPTIIYDLQKYHPQSWKKVKEYQRTIVEKQIYNNLVRGQKEMLYRRDFDPQIVARLFVYKSSSITDHEVFPTELFDRKTLYKEIIKYHFFGIISEKGLKSLLKHYKKHFFI